MQNIIIQILFVESSGVVFIWRKSAVASHFYNTYICIYIYPRYYSKRLLQHNWFIIVILENVFLPEPEALIGRMYFFPDYFSLNSIKCTQKLNSYRSNNFSDLTFFKRTHSTLATKPVREHVQFLLTFNRVTLHIQ